MASPSAGALFATRRQPPRESSTKVAMREKTPVRKRIVALIARRAEARRSGPA